MESKAWFEEWFDSPYYPILYKHRDDCEAELFINNLVSKLKLRSGARVLDMACGRGRHSLYLNKKGFDVAGMDLSEHSIAEAKKKENETLNFYVHDMRKPFSVNYFDAIFNLFTSFGYFDNDKENRQVVGSVQQALKKDGLFILDFMNVTKVIANLVATEEKTVEGIRFKIARGLKDGKVVKDISFDDKGKHFHFSECVRALTRHDLREYFERCKLSIVHEWGDYELNDYDEKKSDRLILVGKK
ncbi:MAG TPA: class I SAM-dependent methyltransferase [Bacteroidia bacterium]|jgi:SAM-dependent methyltransferase